ncbi:MAG: 16S rRNA (cytosine(1402)-N(4))-methyltransferase RsmH [Lachnospiraceae bacterium]
MEFHHVPILLSEVCENLAVKPDGIYLDGTVGGAGHSYEIAKRLRTGRLVGIDQDADAVKAARQRLLPFGDRAAVVRENYIHFDSVLDSLGIGKVDGILLDLGVSSWQFDDAERGFSYRTDAPLDMRMDQRQSLTAADVVNSYSEQELIRVLREYGEEKNAVSIARAIVREREKAPVRTTLQLADLVSRAIPARYHGKGHPAKQTFQAIRIEVNGELTVLSESLSRMVRRLKPGGRFCVITFHSLEDRIVKNCFRTEQNPCVCPPDFPVCVCGRKSLGRVVTPKPIIPSAQEQESNPRSKSAKLRVFERNSEPAWILGPSGRVIRMPEA